MEHRVQKRLVFHQLLLALFLPLPLLIPHLVFPVLVDFGHLHLVEQLLHLLELLEFKLELLGILMVFISVIGFFVDLALDHLIEFAFKL